MGPRLGMVYLCVIVVLALGCAPEPVLPGELFVRTVEGNVFDTAPVRGEARALRLRRSGFEYRCAECHADFDSPARQSELRSEHAGIYKRFSHGLNANCLNCHKRENRNVFVDREGNVIDPENSEVLCAQCHGPAYRDWKAGIHGRLNGYWDRSKGQRTQVTCIQCHDPHSPSFAPMTPDPAPVYSRLEATAPHRRPAAEGETH